MWFTYCQSLYLHRATLLLVAAGSFKNGQTWDYHSEIIGFFVLRAVPGATHTAIAGVSWGCRQETLVSNPTLSFLTSLATLLDIEAILVQICPRWYQGHPPR